MLNLATILEESARRYPSKDAFILGDHAFSYKAISQASSQIANGLKSIGIQKGDKVALSCFNTPHFPIVYFGVLKAGAVVVPLSVLLKENEIQYHLTDSDAKAYFCFIGTEDLPMGQMGYEGFQNAPKCEHFYMIMPDPTMQSPIEGTATMAEFMNGQSPDFEMEQTQAEDTAIIIYTSGTTGKPKGAELTHSNLFINAIISKDLMHSTPEDRTLVVLPLFHIFAMTVLMNSNLYIGSTIVLLPKFDVKHVFGLLQKHKITIFAGVPTMYWGLINYTGDEFDYEAISNNLKICASGGAALPVQVLYDFEKRFNVPIIEGYGMSEGSPVVTFNMAEFGKKPGSIGLPVWGVEVRLVDADGNEVPQGEKGELIYRGHNVMKGYYNKPEANKKTLRNGWLFSGDVAIKDEDGFFYIVDRTKDMIIRGGLNVYPREVEEVIIQHEEVSLVAVIGVPDDKMGEEVKAVVVLKENATVTTDELIAYTKDNIAAYKYPRIVEFVDSLPMSATGKILKKDIPKTR